MIFRFTLAAITAALTLTGCTKHTTSQVQDYATGPSLVTVSHVASLTDDGSLIMVTVDGKDAEPLVRGETAELHMAPGKHKVGGYVSTLLGYGRVTIQPIDVAAVPGQIKHVNYAVLKNKPTFTEIAPTQVPQPAKKPAEPAPAESSQAQATTPAVNPTAVSTATTSGTSTAASNATAATGTSATASNATAATGTSATASNATAATGTSTTASNAAAATGTSTTASNAAAATGTSTTASNAAAATGTSTTASNAAASVVTPATSAATGS
ncbi:hypothetical protein [Erwinia psidii]|uniref:hypothetical protein n=1 Tax=Erwinia psidii TaxID=69224 RepID=UPI0018F7AD78|nr:hypothetical protein [Erwinia psidii]